MKAIMKSINNFFDKASLWKVYIASWFITSLMFGVIFYAMAHLVGINEFQKWPIVKYLKLAAYSGLMFGLMMMLMVSMDRKSRAFWDYCKIVREIAESAKTVEEIRLIRRVELKQLHSLAQADIHYNEFRNIRTVLDTKYSLLKKEVIVEPIPSKEKFTDKFECNIGDKVIPDNIKKAILAIDNTSTFDNGIIRTRLHYDTIQDIINCAD
jgi:hypothetical protein